MSTVTITDVRQGLIDARVLTGLLLVVSVCALVVPLVLFRNPYTVILPVSTLTAGLLGVYYHYRLPQPLRMNVAVHSAFVKNISIIWLVVFALAVALYTINGFTRPLSVSFLLLLLYVLALSTIFVGSRAVITLGFLLTTGLVHRALIYFVNPLPYGVDSHYHYGNAHFITQLGTLEPLQGTKELVAPFYHVAGAVSSLVLNVPIRQGVMFLVLVVAITVVTTLIVFHLTASIWNERSGLVASFLYLVSDHASGELLTLGTTELGLLFFALVLYGLIWYVRTESSRHLAVFLISFFALTFTHHGSIFVIAFAVITFSLCAILLWGLSSRFINLSFLSGTILLFSWTSTTITEEATFLDWMLLNLFRAFSFPWEGGEQLTPEMFGFVSAAPMAGSSYPGVLGTGLLFFFGGFGILYWTLLNRDESRELIVIVGALIAFLLALVFVGSVMGISALVPSRWLKHLYVLLAIPAGIGLLGLLSLIPSRFRTPSTLLVGLLILTVPYMVFMGGSPDGSIDDPIFGDAPAAERMSYTDEEVATTQHAIEYAPDGAAVTSDDFGRAPIRWDRTETASGQFTITVNLDENRPSTGGVETTLLINREYMYSGHTRFGLWTQKLGDHPPLTVRGEVPLQPSTLDSYVKVYHAEEGDCTDTSCGMYVGVH